MKIESIYRNKNERKVDEKGDLIPRMYSKDPVHHPMMIEREYVRSLNATKMERLFAKPFVAALSYHKEGISHLAKNTQSNIFASASYDNQVILWDLQSREIVKKIQFDNIINGISLDNDLNIFVSQNKSVMSYNKDYVSGLFIEKDKYTSVSSIHNSSNLHFTNNRPSMGYDNEYKANGIINAIDVSANSELAVSTTKDLEIFDLNRVTPKTIYNGDGFSKVCFNESFKHIIGAISSMHINLYDNRSCKHFATVDTELASSLRFNPQQGYVFAVGREDGDSLLYDMRKLDAPLNTFRGHVNAVVSLAFNPNGNEIATGSYDRTIRIFETTARKSRDCYYNDRMHIVHGLQYSNDGNFIISGSDDSSLRLWKVNAARKIGPISKLEKQASQYKETLKEKYKNIGEVSRISKHRFLPNSLKQEMKRHHEKFEARVRREEKRKARNEEAP